MEVECKKCHRKFTDRINDQPMQMYTHKGEALCADCINGMGVLPDHNSINHDSLMLDTIRYMIRPN